MIPLGIDPMLAQPSRSVAPTAAKAVDSLMNGLWLFDMKWDGARMVTVIRDGVPRMFSREGNDMTYRYPEVVAWFEEHYGRTSGTYVFDGEAVVFAENGKPSFPLSHRREAQATARAALALSKITPARYAVFDLLIDAGEDIRSLHFDERLERLGKHVAGWSDFTVFHTAPLEDGRTLWAFVNEHNLEGLVAKKITGTYRPGRSYNWVKLKPVRSLSALVAAHEPRTSRGNGALRLVLLGAKNDLVEIGHVGAGLTASSITEMHVNVERAGYAVAEIEFMDVSPDGKLRQPVFKGWRCDIALTDCNISQLEG